MLYFYFTELTGDVILVLTELTCDVILVLYRADL